jgi:peptide/nickel transport system permease protein
MAVAQPQVVAEPIIAIGESSQAQVIWRRFRKHRLAVVGIGILVFLFTVAFIGPAISPYDPNNIVDTPHLEPSAIHWFGTDEIGRDVLTRLMWAGRISLLLAAVVTFGATLVGVVVGAAAGYFGGWVDTIAMRAVDFMLSLPILPLLLILSAMNLRGGLPISIPGFINRFFAWVWSMTPERAENILILATILIIFGWMSIARLVRGQVLALRNMDFTDASRALGVSDWQIIAKHMIPNALAPIIVSATFDFGGVIITEAALSFLGFGVQNPSASWGNMLNNVRDFMLVQPWRAFVPGLTIFLASLSFNFVGDALRDALDPRLKK